MRKLTMAIALAAALALGAWLGLNSIATARQGPAPHAKPAKVARVVRPEVKTSGTQVGSTSQGSDNNDSEVQDRSDLRSHGESDQENEGNDEKEDANESDTHEDLDGQDVNHECPPSCDTAAGEQP